MGLYAVCPAKSEYVLGRAYFPAMTVRVAEGKTLRIENRGNAGTARASLNGKGMEGVVVRHAAVVAGGRLVFG
jgi:putative alpha-1,2-mannosidase